MTHPAPNRHKAAIKEMVRRIVAQFDPERIILFGSQARGGAAPDSDVDLLVVMPLDQSKRKKTVEIRLALHDIGVSKDILLATPDEMARFRDVPGSLIYPVVREGKTLYARK